MAGFRRFDIGFFHKGVLALALSAGLTGCVLWQDEQPSLLQSTAGPAATIQADPVPAVEGLVAMSGAEGAPVCTLVQPSSAGEAGLTEEEAQAGFACLSAGLAGTYGAGVHLLAREFTGWKRVDRVPFEVAALDNRYAAVFANPRALSQDPENTHRDRGYDVGATLAVVTFSAGPDGALELGPLVFIEKMMPGYTPLKGNWRYTFVGPQGDIQAVTGGVNSADITLCADCTHEDADRLYLSLLNNGQIPL